MNYQRFLAKENLQKKFFNNEIKGTMMCIERGTFKDNRLITIQYITFLHETKTYHCYYNEDDESNPYIELII